MKVVVNGKQKVKEYPRLMVDDNLNIVLFKGSNEGTLIDSAKYPEEIADYSEHWVMSEFKDFNGTVTLSNN